MLAAIASSSLGGLSVGVTRLVVGSTDPITLGAFRFGIGSVLLLPLVWRHRARWPNVLALAPIAGLGLLFFGLFPVLFNASLIYTTAARGSLALSTLPLLTMLVAAILQVETLTRAKTAGVVMATIGVAVALFTGLGLDASNAWRGDVLMVAAALCMAFYSVWSRALAKQYGAIAYTALHDIWRPRACSCGRDARWLRSDRGIRTYPVERCRISRYIRWCPHVPALQRTTPTRVAISVTVNPVVSAIFGAYALDEPITVNLVLGLLLVAIGILVASSTPKETTVRM